MYVYNNVEQIFNLIIYDHYSFNMNNCTVIPYLLMAKDNSHKWASIICVEITSKE